eukprot:gene17154-10422_t
MFYVGAQETPGGPFVSDPARATAVDWGFATPSNVTTGGLDHPKGHGRSQMNCPKTAAGPSRRRVLFGWLTNGFPNHEPDRPWGADPGLVTNSNNTMALPRD